MSDTPHLGPDRHHVDRSHLPTLLKEFVGKVTQVEQAIVPPDDTPIRIRVLRRAVRWLGLAVRAQVERLPWATVPER